MLRAVRYAGSLRPTEIRAVHIMLDNEVAQRLERAWIERGLGDRVPLVHPVRVPVQHLRDRGRRYAGQLGHRA